MNEMTSATAVGATVSRREFLSRTAILTGTLWASSNALLALAPTPVWALELKTFDERAALMLSGVTRQIFPHASLDDAVYAFVVRDLDAAAADAATRDLLLSGIKDLDSAASGDWLSQTEATKLATVTAIAHNPFFEKVRSTAVVSLYNNELAFAHFGYQGEAYSKGGYLERGFNSLTWLPAPSADASPAAQ